MKDYQQVWERIAESYTSFRAERKLSFLYPALLHIVDDCCEGGALDLGCGDAGFSIELVKRGWKVLAVDPAPTMIRIARMNRDAAGFGDDTLQLLVSDHEGLAGRYDMSFDLAVINLVLTVVPTREEIVAVLRATARSLKRKGTLIASIIHPCFGGVCINASKNMASGLPAYDLSGARYEVTIPLEDGSAVRFDDYHWTLADYSAFFQSAGFSISRMVEPGVSCDALSRLYHGTGLQIHYEPFLVFLCSPEISKLP